MKLSLAGRLGFVLFLKAEMPEDSFSGMGVPEHGYASNTPVADGERVFVFFGKAGVLAYDLDGNQRWQVNVGQQSSNRRWGSSASPAISDGQLLLRSNRYLYCVEAR